MAVKIRQTSIDYFINLGLLDSLNYKSILFILFRHIVFNFYYVTNDKCLYSNIMHISCIR